MLSHERYNAWAVGVDALHTQAKDRVRTYLDTESEPGKRMHRLVEWMLTTDADPHRYLESRWASQVYTPTGLAYLLDRIADATECEEYGEITFVAVWQEPMIVLAHPDSQDLIERAIGLSNFHPAYDLQSKGSIEILDIKLSEFGAVHDAWRREQLRRDFILDARSTDNLSQVISKYQRRPLWDEGIVKEFLFYKLQTADF